MLRILLNKRFALIGSLEIIERLAWYSFYYTIAYYFINTLGFSEKESMLLKGAVAAMLYAGNAIGGLISDKLLGIKRTLILAIILLSLGYLLVALDTGNYSFVILGIAFVTMGGFLFKPQPLTLLVNIFKNSEAQRDGAATLYYQFVNIGSLIAASCAPILVIHYGYSIIYSFLGISVVSAGIIISMNYKLYTQYDNAQGLNKLTSLKIFKVLAILIAIYAFLIFVFHHSTLAFGLLIGCTILIISYFFYQVSKIPNRLERQKALNVLPILLLGIVFFVMYEQMDSSALLFTLHHSKTNLFGYEMNSQSVAGTLNSAGIIILAPLMAWFYNSKFGKSLTIQHKFTIGLLSATCTIATLWLSTFSVEASGRINIYWMVLAITLFFSAGELLVSALGATALSGLVPEKMRGFIIGLWYLASALGFKLGAWLSSLVASGKKLGEVIVLTGQDKIDSFYGYQQLYGWLFIGCVIATIIGSAIALGVEKKLSSNLTINPA